MLKKYLKDRGITQENFAHKIGITSSGLKHILTKKSPETKLITCLRIQRETGLKPWQYLNGLEGLSKLK